MERIENHEMQLLDGEKCSKHEICRTKSGYQEQLKLLAIKHQEQLKNLELSLRAENKSKEHCCDQQITLYKEQLS